MTKPRKRDSRRLSQKEIKKKEARKKAREAAEQHDPEWKRYSLPEHRTESAVEMCKQRVLKGEKLCWCKERCICRACQARKEDKCDLERLKVESVGCSSGCYMCSEHKPCY